MLTNPDEQGRVHRTRPWLANEFLNFSPADAKLVKSYLDTHTPAPVG